MFHVAWTRLCIALALWIAIFWLHLLIPVATIETVFILWNIVLIRWKSNPKARSIRVSLNQGRQIRLLYLSGEILESVAKSLLRINEHAIANVFLYLCFQLRIMYAKKLYFYTVRIYINHEICRLPSGNVSTYSCLHRGPLHSHELLPAMHICL